MVSLDSVRKEVFKNNTNLVGNDILSVFIKKIGVDSPADPLKPEKYKGMRKKGKIEKFAAQILNKEESEKQISVKIARPDCIITTKGDTGSTASPGLNSGASSNFIVKTRSKKKVNGGLAG